MNCAKCGTANSDGSKFCNNCGNVLTGSTVPTSAPGVPVPTQPRVMPPQPIAVIAEGAKTSLILGILAFLFCGFPTGIPAVIVGRRAIKRIQQSRGMLRGQEIALAGVIMGCVSCAIWLVFFLFSGAIFKLAFKEMSESESATVASIRQINDAQTSFTQIYSGNTGRLYAGSLATLGPGPSGACNGTGSRDYACLMDGPLVKADCREPHWCVVNGYKFLVRRQDVPGSRDGDYVITAIPAKMTEGGTKNFCSTSDGVVRSEIWGELSAGYNADECRRLKPVEEGK